MKKKILAALLAALCALLIQFSASHASDWNDSNPFIEMMRSMLTMFEMMQMYQNFSGYPDQFGMPPQFSPEQFSQFPFAQSDKSPLQLMPSAPNINSTPSIDGLWVSDDNILLVLKQNYAQIYWSRTQFRNYYLRKTENQLVFADTETGDLQTFDMVTQNDQMALRDKQGKQLLFRKLSTEQLQSYQ